MSHERKDKKDMSDEFKNIPDLVPEDFNLENFLSRVDQEKIFQLINTISQNLNKRDKRIEVLSMLKEFLPEERCKIVDMFITALGGKVN
ncbi:hypothetical protein [Caloramator sp. Dgby_cultured_2]|uniref:hypothetical protein n=1 Tax=Caloramator sp. Dgby_cultured_2 TaxID=3029174 RepID=UPI00237D94EA|nr:hypothetical protein [Caloramator sp. Dgby_cultured_2]WDU82337.1 hypothetical protein PWK10_11660 [Caloramator sp. Dgby_cultured_2]